MCEIGDLPSLVPWVCPSSLLLVFLTLLQPWTFSIVNGVCVEWVIGCQQSIWTWIQSHLIADGRKWRRVSWSANQWHNDTPPPDVDPKRISYVIIVCVCSMIIVCVCVWVIDWNRNTNRKWNRKRTNNNKIDTGHLVYDRLWALCYSLFGVTITLD